MELADKELLSSWLGGRVTPPRGICILFFLLFLLFLLIIIIFVFFSLLFRATLLIVSYILNPVVFSVAQTSPAKTFFLKIEMVFSFL